HPARHSPPRTLTRPDRESHGCRVWGHGGHARDLVDVGGREELVDGAMLRGQDPIEIRAISHDLAAAAFETARRAESERDDESAQPPPPACRRHGVPRYLRFFSKALTSTANCLASYLAGFSIAANRRSSASPAALSGLLPGALE